MPKARLLGTAFAAALLSLGPAAGASEWVEVTSPSFVVVSDAGAGTAKHVARELEVIRAVYQSALPEMRLAPDGVRVYAVENVESLARLLPEYDEPGATPPGVFRPGFGRNDILVRTDTREEHPDALLHHEYFHLLARANLPVLPLWLDEGLAELWGHTVFRRSRVELGVPIQQHLAILRGDPPLSLDAVLAADRDSPSYRAPGARALFYARSWALTHYIVLGDSGARRGELDAYLEALSRGVDPKRAGREVFGELSELEKRLDAYARRERLERVEAKVPRAPETGDLTLRELSQAESLAMRADFLVWGPSFEKARALATGALARDPELALAQEVLGALELRARERPRAFAWFDAATRSVGASHLAYFYAATLAPPEAELDLERALRSAIAARPTFTPAYAELAFHRAGRGALDEALALVERAAELSPGSSWYRSLVARALWQRGERSEAMSEMRRAVLLALEAGRAEDAHAICRDGSLAGMAEAVLPACDRAVALRPENEGYHDSRAVARALAGDREGAVTDLRASLALDGPTPGDGASERRLWIRRLEDGGEILTEAARRALLGRPF